MKKLEIPFLNLDNDYFILCRDFNLVLNPEMDTFNYCNVNDPKARENVLDNIKDLQLVDYFKILHPDRVISESLTNMTEKFSIKSGYGSDNSAVVSELKFNKCSRARGLWKFHNSLLTDQTYVEKVKKKNYF